METIVSVPSEWALAYLVCILLCTYKVQKTDKLELFFTLGMISLLALTIGLRLSYAY